MAGEAGAGLVRATELQQWKGAFAVMITILTSGVSIPRPLAIVFSRPVPAAERLPVTVLTGYLGAGKTTLLNRVLTYQHGRKVAVIVNEFEEIGIDNQLVVDTDEEIFQMNNDCICYIVRDNLT